MYLLQANAETPEDLLHVAALLHGDDTQVILLVDPDQEGLVVVVPGLQWMQRINIQENTHTRDAQTK